jgi:hypothetical protein
LKLLHMNSSMASIFTLELSKRATRLPARLRELLKGGIVVRNDCFFLKSLLDKSKSARLADFADRTGFECFVNHFHIDDYSTANQLPLSLSVITATSRLIKKRCQKRKIYAVLGMDGDSVNLRFYTFRRNESWLGSDLEKYEDAVCLIQVNP